MRALLYCFAVLCFFLPFSLQAQPLENGPSVSYPSAFLPQLTLKGFINVDLLQTHREKIRDEFGFRHIRPTLEATFLKKVTLVLSPELSIPEPYLADIYIKFLLPGRSEQVKMGKMKPPFGQERIDSDTKIAFRERSLVTNFSPARDVGIALEGTWEALKGSYSLALMNGNIDNGREDKDEDTAKDLYGRLIFFPTPMQEGVKPLELGISFSAGDHRGNLLHPELPEYRTSYSQRIFSYRKDNDLYADGVYWRLSPHLRWYHKQIGLDTEYALVSPKLHASQGSQRLYHSAWSIMSRYVLSGETLSPEGVKPKKPVSFRLRQGGALEIAGRVSHIHFDSKAFPLYATHQSVQSAVAYGVGLNWYLTSFLKMMVNYEQTHFSKEGIAPKPEKVISSRIQFQF